MQNKVRRKIATRNLSRGTTGTGKSTNCECSRPPTHFTKRKFTITRLLRGRRRYVTEVIRFPITFVIGRCSMILIVKIMGREIFQRERRGKKGRIFQFHEVNSHFHLCPTFFFNLARDLLKLRCLIKLNTPLRLKRNLRFDKNICTLMDTFINNCNCSYSYNGIIITQSSNLH